MRRCHPGVGTDRRGCPRPRFPALGRAVRKSREQHSTFNIQWGHLDAVLETRSWKLREPAARMATLRGVGFPAGGCGRHLAARSCLSLAPPG
jgi:hypothetical protein